MPRRTDIETILILGAGPITIGQACEFDYSGSQACRALREEGYRVVLVNSNPATIMTDPEMADATYIEPLRWQVVAEIIRKEKPDALLPTMGGQTALNVTMQLDENGVLQKHGVQLIGASRQAIARAEDRGLFGEAMRRIGLDMPRALVTSSLDEARLIRRELGYPVILRPSFTLGGGGSGVACNNQEFDELCAQALRASPSHQVLLEEPVLGWKEFELEVVRDCQDNCIIVCSIENIDPMGIHTGDSITVAPAQTLTDKEYQCMRNAAVAILREIGVDTGGSNVQFAVNPETGRMVVIEMNPRVSRSSSLASKATGFPIARVAAKLAVGYTLDELSNEITGGAMPASFEPMIDYVVTKLPRFNFEKFDVADHEHSLDDRLTTQMKSVGEVMAIGRTFQESLQKALRSLEDGGFGLEEHLSPDDPDRMECLRGELRVARSRRLWYVADAFRQGMSVADIHECSRIDPWFLRQIQELVQVESELRGTSIAALDAPRLRGLKRQGFSDHRLAALLNSDEATVRALRARHDVYPAYKRVDSCAAEFATPTAYMYSSYDQESEALPSKHRKIMILGSGPNRIGQGIEFDYCCVHAAQALRAESCETIMVNCNPETVSTDYDVSDRLYFEPLTLEDVLAIARLERPDGTIVQFGGQTPLGLARGLEEHGVKLIGTTPDSIDLAEDRERFKGLLDELGLQQPDNATTQSLEEARRLARALGYPLVLRPSYVLGGRAMEIVYNEADLERYFHTAMRYIKQAPILLDRFLENAIEVDVDAVSDGREVFIGGIMEHIEKAGIHSGDSACCMPPQSLSGAVQARLAEQVCKLAAAMHVVGLMNVQFAVQGEHIYVLEVNPRASRSIPYVSKATGIPLARVAARCMIGRSLHEQGYSPRPFKLSHYAVKEAVLPFDRLPGADPLLGPEMKSTGEVMGMGADFGEAFYKAACAVHMQLPREGLVFISVKDADKDAVGSIARKLLKLGFTLCATHGTAAALSAQRVECARVNKVLEGQPHVVDMLTDGEINFIINTTAGRQAIRDSYSIRRTALQRNVFYVTTLAGAEAAICALQYKDNGNVLSLQDRFADWTTARTA